MPPACTLLVAAFVVAFVVPWLLPAQRAANFQHDLVYKVSAPPLHDPLGAGLFKRSPLSGDTQPSWQATFWAACALSKVTGGFAAARSTTRRPIPSAAVREAHSVFSAHRAQLVARLRRSQAVALPTDLDYGALAGLSCEEVEKLSHARPRTLEEAGGMRKTRG